MHHDRQACLSAVRVRDRAADGRFVTAVVTTGIYCRASCPARAKETNMRFLPDPAAARAAGFRACRRCHPDDAFRPEAARHATMG